MSRLGLRVTVGFLWGCVAIRVLDCSLSLPPGFPRKHPWSYPPWSLPNLHLRSSGLCPWMSRPPWVIFTGSSLSQPSRYHAQASLHLLVGLVTPFSPEATPLAGPSCSLVPALHWPFPRCPARL